MPRPAQLVLLLELERNWSCLGQLEQRPETRLAPPGLRQIVQSLLLIGRFEPLIDPDHFAGPVDLGPCRSSLKTLTLTRRLADRSGFDPDRQLGLLVSRLATFQMASRSGSDLDLIVDRVADLDPEIGLATDLAHQVAQSETLLARFQMVNRLGFGPCRQHRLEWMRHW